MPAKAGDILWLVPAHRRGGQTSIEVTRVGRKWAYFDWHGSEQRFDATSGWIDGHGYASPGRVYPSRDYYEAEALADRSWDGLARLMRGARPSGVYLWHIDEARRLLSLPAIAIEARSDATGTGAAEGESAGPKDIAQGDAA